MHALHTGNRGFNRSQQHVSCAATNKAAAIMNVLDLPHSDFENPVQRTSTAPGLPMVTDWVHQLDLLSDVHSAVNLVESGDFLPCSSTPDFLDAAEPKQTSVDQLTIAERKANTLAGNRLAQRRSRARKKAREEGAEAQLAVSSAELQDLLSKQKGLEARNALLEKIVQLGPKQQQQQPKSDAVCSPSVSTLCYTRCHYLTILCYATAMPVQEVQDLRTPCGFKDLPGPTAKYLASTQAVKLTIDQDREQIIELHEILAMPFKDFARLYTVSLQDAYKTACCTSPLCFYCCCSCCFLCWLSTKMQATFSTGLL